MWGVEVCFEESEDGGRKTEDYFRKQQALTAIDGDACKTSSITGLKLRTSDLGLPTLSYRIFFHKPLRRSIIIKFKHRIRRIEAEESAAPPVARYGTIAIVFHAHVIHFILQVNMATDRGFDIGILLKNCIERNEVGVHQVALDLQVAIGFCFIKK